MSDAKCKICGEMKPCIITWDYNFCAECFNKRCLIYNNSKAIGVIFQKLISRIEKLEEAIEELHFFNRDTCAVWDLCKTRIEKLEHKEK